MPHKDARNLNTPEKLKGITMNCKNFKKAFHVCFLWSALGSLNVQAAYDGSLQRVLPEGNIIGKADIYNTQAFLGGRLRNLLWGSCAGKHHATLMPGRGAEMPVAYPVFVHKWAASLVILIPGAVFWGLTML